MSIASVLFPVSCVGCGASGPALCPRCLSGLAPPAAWPVPAGLDSCVALTSYEGVARQVIAGVKYRNDRSALGALASSAAHLVADTPVGVITWVPTVPSRRRGRGFDQAELLARAVARRVRRPVRGLLARPEGAAQTGRDRLSRTAPTPFVLRRPVCGPVLLVDDVVTTGSTLTAAAVELRRGGADAVHGLALGHTPELSGSATPIDSGRRRTNHSGVTNATQGNGRLSRR